MEALISKILAHYQRDLPFVLYALPESEMVVALLQKNNKRYLSSEFSEKGFVMAPFDAGDNLLIPETESEVLSLTFSEIRCEPVIVSTGATASENKSYKTRVAEAVKHISEGNASKIVISRCKKIGIKNFDLSQLIHRLLTLYPTAFRYVWHHPSSGLWCGASPEVLINTNGQAFNTMAVAGTRKYQENIRPEWTPKEINEQQWVVDDVSDKLNYVASVVKVSGLKNYRAGSLVHLRTDFKGMFKKHGNNLAILARSLHPTAAVCGTPNNIAKDFIKRHENYDRSYYTGFLGPIDSRSGRSELFVNLRCMKLNKSSAHLYVGGGITEDSLPDAEWEETENKLQTMLQVLAPLL